MTPNVEHESESKVTHGAQIDHEPARTRHEADAIAHEVIDNLRYLLAKLPHYATRNDWYMALAYAVRKRMLDGYIATV